VSDGTVVEAPGPLKGGMTPKRLFTIIAIVLGLILVALLLYILLLLNDTSLVELFEGEERPPGIEPILAIEGPGTGENPRFDRPLGVAFGDDDRIYVSDTGNNRVCAFDVDGEFLFEFGGFGVRKPAPGVTAEYEEGRLNFPAGIDCDEDGNVYVADFRNDQIQVFDPEGEFLRAFPDPFEPTGRGSSGEGGGIATTDVEAKDGKVYATDRYQVFVFDVTGELLLQFGKPGTGPGDLDHPNGIAVGDDGTVFVGDSNHNRVVAFEATGEPLWNLGRIPEGIADTESREFGLPRGMTVLDDDVLLVVDAFDFTLVRVSPEGEMLSTHGERGVDRGQFNFPNDVDSSGSLVVVADKENDRVQLLRLTDE
jgi:sugar lactone lactonase YvrE